MLMELVEGDGLVLRTIATAAEERLPLALQGSCASHPDPGLWHRDDDKAPYDEHDENYFSKEDTRTALAICRSCPVRTWCEATFDAEPHGVFGGRTAVQRVKRRDRLGNRERDRERLRAWRQRRKDVTDPPKV